MLFFCGFKFFENSLIFGEAFVLNLSSYFKVKRFFNSRLIKSPLTISIVDPNSCCTCFFSPVNCASLVYKLCITFLACQDTRKLLLLDYNASIYRKVDFNCLLLL